MDIIERLIGTEFEGCVRYLPDGRYYFRWDIPYHATSRDTFEEFCEVNTLLAENGLILQNTLTEHDCITGDVFDAKWLSLRRTVAEIETERKHRKEKV